MNLIARPILHCSSFRVSRIIPSKIKSTEFLKYSNAISLVLHSEECFGTYSGSSKSFKFSKQQYSVLTNQKGTLNKYALRSNSNDTGNSQETLTRKEKFKKAVKQYGPTVMVFHVTISLLSLGGCYVLVDSGVDIASMIADWGLPLEKFSANAGTFVVAYAVHKVFAPVRIFITLSVAPFLVQYLRNVGILKK